MNRTDRLYAIVETLRAAAPRRRSARELAARYEVSVRTIERDINALQQAGVPIYADAGRTGGYALDASMSLPPLNFTPAEAVAVAVALRSGTPFTDAARGALRKIMAAMPARDVSAVADLADRVRFFVAAPATPAVSPVLSDALVRRRVVRLVYLDKTGRLTERTVEPLMFLAGEHGWYLQAYCRLREDVRAFRVDRVLDAQDCGETAPPRPPVLGPSVPDNVALSATFD